MASPRQFMRDVYNAGLRIGLSPVVARVAAAQAANESDFGRKAPGNNFFGIKTGKSWKGKTQTFGTWEVVNGKKKRQPDRFRAYDTFEESLKDWKSLIERRFPDVLTAKTFEEAIDGLKAGKKGGYATDPLYNSKLTNIDARFSPTVDALPDIGPQIAAAPSLRSSTPRFAMGGILSPPEISFSPISAAMAEENRAQAIQNAMPSFNPGPAFTSPPSAMNVATMSGVPTPTARPGLISPAPAPTSRPSAGLIAAPAQDDNPYAGIGVSNETWGRMKAGVQQPTAAPSTAGLSRNAFDIGRSVEDARAVESAAQPSTAGLSRNPFDVGIAAPQDMPSQPMDPDFTPAPEITEQNRVAPADVFAPVATPPTVAAPTPTPRPTPVTPAAAPVDQSVSVNSFPSAPPAPSQPTGYDFWSGQSPYGVANNGALLSRDALGNTYHYSPTYDYTEVTTPQGFRSTKKGIYGPLSPEFDDSAQKATGLLGNIDKGKVANAAKGALGAAAGGMAGSALGGPIGGLLGAALGKSLASGQGFKGVFGNSRTTPGFGTNSFPSAPAAPAGSYGGPSHSNRSHEGMMGISPGATAAIDAGQAGLW